MVCRRERPREGSRGGRHAGERPGSESVRLPLETSKKSTVNDVRREGCCKSHELAHASNSDNIQGFCKKNLSRFVFGAPLKGYLSIAEPPINEEAMRTHIALYYW